MTKFKRLDVGRLLARGLEPLPVVLERVERLGAGEGLMVVAPFLPSPLIQLLRREGFDSRCEQRRTAEWITYFWRNQ